MLETNENFKEINTILNRYKKGEYLIQILRDIQNKYGYISEEVQKYIAVKMNIPVSKINGVVTFYSLFNTKPKGKYTIGVCMGTACYVKGAMDILTKIKDELSIKEGETTEDLLFTLSVTRCIGACGLAPLITINDDVYGRLTTNEIPEILNKYKEQKEAAN